MRLFLPPPKLTVSKWADTYRYLSSEVSAEGGKYRSARTPYQREPMDSPHDPQCSEFILVWGKQLGKTEIMNNIIGYTIDQAPRSMLVGYPTIDSGKAWSKDKLTPMFNASPCFRGKISDGRTRDSANTILHKRYPGGVMYVVGANSPSGLRQRSVPMVLLDEIDAMEPNAEGDPVSQADGRAENFHDAYFFKSSTATSSHGAIWQFFLESDQRYWFCPCPKCQHWQKLEWAQVKWSWQQADGVTFSDPKLAVYVCAGCQAELTDSERIAMVEQGEWRATAPFRGKRGWHLNGLYRVMGKKKSYTSLLHEFVEKYLQAKQGGRDKLQVWWNTFRAEPFDDEMEIVDADPIMARRECYGPELPAGTVVLIGKVDTQANRLELDVWGFGREDEAWAIRFRRIFGSPHQPEVWAELDAELRRPYQHPAGAKLRISILGIDSGGVDGQGQAFAVPVYDFVRKHQQASRGRCGVIALKGSSTRGAPLALERLQKNGVNLLLVGTDTAKSTVYERLKITAPGPRFIHFPKAFDKNGQKVEGGYDEEYFRQLVAEEIRLIKRHGFTFRDWFKRYQRNEALDLAGYGLALFELLNPDMDALAGQLNVPSELAARPAQQRVRRPQRRPRGFGI